MARDRQRSKGRRKRSTRTPKPARPQGARARDIGLDEATVDQAGLGEATFEEADLDEPTAEEASRSRATPGPLRGATPYADEARLAEAGAEIPTPDGELDRAPDEVEGDLLPAGGRGGRDLQAAISEAPAERPERRPRSRFITFLGHVVDELKRVQWPNRRQVGQATAVVLGFVILAGGYLGLMDAIWKPIVNLII